MLGMLARSCTFTLLLSVFVVGSAHAGASTTELCFDVSLRGGTAEICADVHENRKALPFGATIFAVHGLSETAASWGPLVDALFEDPHIGWLVRRVIAIDLPGHGDSPIPVGLPGGLFGELLIEDNISVIIQSLDILDAAGLPSRTIMGHSMGGLAIQGAQETLLAQGSKLADLGVRHAILLAPVPAAGQQWTQPPPADITPFLITQPGIGTIFALSPLAFQQGGSFRTLSGALIPNLPSVAELAPKVGIEPLNTLLQLVGALPIPRGPVVREGAFKTLNGTLLTLISFSEDILTPAIDLDDLYRHLIGRPGLLYRPIVAPDAVHGMFISNPEGLLEELKELPFSF